jgi:hypothetical protein
MRRVDLLVIGLALGVARAQADGRLAGEIRPLRRRPGALLPRLDLGEAVAVVESSSDRVCERQAKWC